MGRLIALPLTVVIIVGFWGLVIYGLKHVVAALMRTRHKADLFDAQQHMRAEAELSTAIVENDTLKAALAELRAERRERLLSENKLSPRRVA